MINRAYALVNGQQYISSEVAPFSDIKKCDAETQNAISMLYELKITTGSNGKFMPSDPTTRSQVAKILVSFLNTGE